MTLICSLELRVSLSVATCCRDRLLETYNIGVRYMRPLCSHAPGGHIVPVWITCDHFIRTHRMERHCSLLTPPAPFPNELIDDSSAAMLFQVWDWASQRRPFRVYRARGGDPCLLYHASLWGRTLAELRVAAGTVFNQVRQRVT